MVAEGCDCRFGRVPTQLGLPQEPLPFLRSGKWPGEEHLEGDLPVEPQVPGPVDDAATPLADHFFQLVSGDRRQLG